ncbi:M1 family metallopeptidase [Nitrogeniibacter mangrovi]|uniref:M1 family metallopeptidase n=1 Tax=Nitrogeniibacter mangrovi TaxID=2016596 RepID=A0A6C1B4J0_9RHOO|nr:M1 family aminopeptidase [Nitrogeniibacter mangrovi]QID18353.1 M1 family metallopeptidase [Nitrogeniibacter mangrovi]
MCLFPVSIRQCRRFGLRGAFALIATTLALLARAAAPGVVHHDLQVSLDPARHHIRVTDTLTLPDDARGPLRLWLGAAFHLDAPPATLKPLDASDDGRFRAWRLELPANTRRITLSYAGTIETDTAHVEHAMPPAWIDTHGVYLDGASAWVPRVDGHPVRFTLRVDGPAGWTYLSQGRREDDGRRWVSDTPQEDIYLLAGPFARTDRAHGPVTLETDLLADDPALAGRYLAVMGGYIDFFSALLGPYPYPRFAVVENRWQTGYGMPGFTLLGSQVLRLPFILHSSLPHEILHNWWGNGVWVDARDGNWCEGLTAYLADHLIQEAIGAGADYRRKLLERYTAFAAAGRDLPLRDFRSRHSEATQAVGYGKMLMLVHMQRRHMGDAAFVAALRQLWQRHRFSTATMDDVAAALNPDGSGTAFAPIWRNTAGAPQIAIAGLDVTPQAAGGQRLDLRLQQTQSGAAYPLSVPVTVQLADGSRDDLSLDFTGKSARLQQHYASAPVRVDVDPQFDVFRRLDPGEQPSALARLFGAATQWLILPDAADPDQRAAWQALADAWQQRYGNVRIVSDSALATVPADAAVWVLGWHNRALAALRPRFNTPGQGLDTAAATVGPTRYTAADHAVVLLDADNRRAPLGFIGAATPADIAALARKLPHYSTYGRLVFAAGTMNRLVGEALPVSHSPLSRVLGTTDPGPPTERRPPLADQVEVALPSGR